VPAVLLGEVEPKLLEQHEKVREQSNVSLSNTLHCNCFQKLIEGLIMALSTEVLNIVMATSKFAAI
jgi:hypothetical protein